MSDVSPLVGTRVDAVAFGLAHFQIRVSRDDQEFSVSSSADISVEKLETDAVDFRHSKLAAGLIELVGAELIDIETDDASHVAVVKFDDEKAVRAWWPDKVHDNLFVVRRERSDEWWVIG